MTVTIDVSETGAMVAAAEKGNKTVTFNAGSTTAAISVPTVDDGTSEDDSTITVEVVAGAGYDVHGARHAKSRAVARHLADKLAA